MREHIAELFELSLDSARLDEALTHPSYRNEQASEHDNQRLEFLGDAVLGFCVTEVLFARFPDADEGRLTRMRARLVNAKTLGTWARQNELSDALLLGRGATASGLCHSTNVLADAVEALIAATFLDAGLEAARRICATIVAEELQRIQAWDGRDPKSELQERVQAAGGGPPTYVVEQSGGPAHDRWFEVSVRVAGDIVAHGKGRSKRVAEQAAAGAALQTGAFQPAAPTGSHDEEEREARE